MQIKFVDFQDDYLILNLLPDSFSGNGGGGGVGVGGHKTSGAPLQTSRIARELIRAL